MSFMLFLELLLGALIVVFVLKSLMTLLYRALTGVRSESDGGPDQ